MIEEVRCSEELSIGLESFNDMFAEDDRVFEESKCSLEILAVVSFQALCVLFAEAARVD